MTRMISIPGLQPRTARGQTGADQFLAQVETGYKIGIYAPAAASLIELATSLARKPRGLTGVPLDISPAGRA